MRSLICRRRSGLKLIVFGLLLLASVLLISLMSLTSRGPVMSVAAASTKDAAASYWDSARQLLGSGLLEMGTGGGGASETRNHKGAANFLSSADDPRTLQVLRGSIDRTSNLIGDYQEEGLANMPPLPNVPGLNAIMRLPDKLLRAELSMLQDGIRMAEEMRERPIAATVNTPRELTNMMMRMMQQLSQ